MQEHATQHGMGKGTQTAFWAIVLLYAGVFSGLACWAAYRCEIWLVTGLFISLLYAVVACYYFYSGYFIPFHQEKRRVRVEGRGLVLLLSQWVFPIAVIQVFICLAFWLTIDHVPSRKTMYTNPYQYGLIYKQLDAEKKKANNAAGVEGFVKESVPFFNLKALPEEKADAKTQRPGGTVVSGSIPKPAETAAPKTPEATDAKTTKLMIFTIPFYIAVTFGFLGSLIYTLRDIVYRFYTEDLQPRTFVNYIIRFIFAVVVCIVVAYFLMNDWWVNAAPLIFFFIGYFPDRGMQYIEETAMKWLNFKKEERLDLPLGLLQGTNDYLIYRFKEIGIHDIQNLAYVDLNELRTNIGYGAGLLCDFVAQALLFIQLKDHFAALQGFGIRNIVCFRRVINAQNYDSIAKAMGIPGQKLLNTLEVMNLEPMKKRIDDLETCRMNLSPAEEG
jgi:hypothetical protein